MAFHLVVHLGSCCFLNAEGLSVLLARFRVFQVVFSVNLKDEADF